jgi:hypothetical protein
VLEITQANPASQNSCVMAKYRETITLVPTNEQAIGNIVLATMMIIK